MCEIMAHQEVPEPQGATADVFTLITRAASETAGIEDLQAFLRAATANPEEVGATLDASPWSAVAILRLRALRDLTPLGQMLVVAMIDTGSMVVLQILESPGVHQALQHHPGSCVNHCHDEHLTQGGEVPQRTDAADADVAPWTGIEHG